MGKRLEPIGHKTYQGQETPGYYYSSVAVKISGKKKARRTIAAPAKKSLLLSYKGLKAIFLGFLILFSLGTYAGNVSAQQILLGPDGQPVRQPGYQTQSFAQTPDSTSNYLIWMITAVLVMVGLSVYWAQKNELVFFNDWTDIWVTVSAVVLEGLLFFFNNGSFVIYGAAGIAAYHFYCAYRYNSNNIAGAFIIAISRIVIGVVVPVLAFYIFFRAVARQGDESEWAFAIRSAIHMAAKAAMLFGLFIFLTSLVNGEQVRSARGETDFSESSFSRASSNRQSSYKKQSSFNEQASSRTYSKEQTSSNKRENFKTAPQEEPSDYDILGVPRTASFQDIQRAYRKKMLKTHPDRLAGMAAKYRRMAEEECKKINAAFDRLRKARNYGFA